MGYEKQKQKSNRQILSRNPPLSVTDRGGLLLRFALQMRKGKPSVVSSFLPLQPPPSPPRGSLGLLLLLSAASPLSFSSLSSLLSPLFSPRPLLSLHSLWFWHPSLLFHRLYTFTSSVLPSAPSLLSLLWLMCLCYVCSLSCLLALLTHLSSCYLLFPVYSLVLCCPLLSPPPLAHFSFCLVSSTQRVLPFSTVTSLSALSHSPLSLLSLPSSVCPLSDGPDRKEGPSGKILKRQTRAWSGFVLPSYVHRSSCHSAE